MMGDPAFLRSLQEMNVERITLKQQQAVRAHMKKTTKLDQMQNISKAGYGLYKFVLAVLDYCTVYREVLARHALRLLLAKRLAAVTMPHCEHAFPFQVKPKIERVEMLEAESERARRAMEREQRELKRIEKAITDLNAKYETAMGERQELQEETDLMQRRLIAADRLITGLSSENQRWKKELDSLHGQIDNIIGNCLISAGFLAYCGPFTYEYRNRMLYNDWWNNLLAKKIPFTDTFTIETQLSNDVEIST